MDKKCSCCRMLKGNVKSDEMMKRCVIIMTQRQFCIYQRSLLKINDPCHDDRC
jgi:ribosomal protein S17